MQKTELKHRKLFDRVGMLAAFTLLDIDGDGTVSQDEFSVIIEKKK